MLLMPIALCRAVLRGNCGWSSIPAQGSPDEGCRRFLLLQMVAERVSMELQNHLRCGAARVAVVRDLLPFEAVWGLCPLQ